jgi:hypothetical protein
MTKHGVLEFGGHVTHKSQRGLFCVTLDNNVDMLAKVCGPAWLPWDSRGTGRPCPCGRVAGRMTSGVG